MKILLFSVFFGFTLGVSTSDGRDLGKIRFADAAVDACLSSCSSRAETCKRVCPTTLNTPCLSTCDSQAQTCRESCQRR